MTQRIVILFLLSCLSILKVLSQSDLQKLLLSGAEEGNVYKMAQTGYDYLTGSQGFPKDKEKGTKWCLEAIQNGYLHAWESLGLGLIDGFGDYDEGIKCLEIACDKCEGKLRASAAYFLADIFQYGKWNNKVDINNAIKYHRITASIDEDYARSLWACKNLGHIYKKKGIKEEAIYWYKKAMDKVYAKNGSIDMDISNELEELGVYYHPEDKSATGSYNSSASDHSHSHASSSMQSSSPKQSSSSTYTPEYGFRDVWVDCYHCHGDGKCPSCGGAGWCVSTYSSGGYNTTYTCPVCHGNRFCTICGGTKGHYEKQRYQIK